MFRLASHTGRASVLTTRFQARYVSAFRAGGGGGGTVSDSTTAPTTAAADHGIPFALRKSSSKARKDGERAFEKGKP